MRIVAPLATRIAYVPHREGRDEAAALARIRHKEEERRRYLETFYERQPSDAQLYDLLLNTGSLNLEGAGEVMVLALAVKARRLATAAQDLGLAAGVTPYPGQPEDFRPAR